jgi:hypothetical protein
LRFPRRQELYQHAADRNRIALARGMGAHHAGNRRLDFDLGLVGFDREDGLALANRLAGLFVPADNFTLGHRVPQLGHLDRCRHYVTEVYLLELPSLAEPKRAGPIW